MVEMLYKLGKRGEMIAQVRSIEAGGPLIDHAGNLIYIAIFQAEKKVGKSSHFKPNQK